MFMRIDYKSKTTEIKFFDEYKTVKSLTKNKFKRSFDDNEENRAMQEI